MNKKFVLVFIFLIPFLSRINAQTNKTQTPPQQQNKYVADADKAFRELRYDDAIEKYKKAYSKIKKDKNERARMKFMTAECYRKKGDTKQAEDWYAKVLKEYQDPVIYFDYAEMLRANEKYEDAISNYNMYKEKASGGTHIAEAELGIKSCEQAAKWKVNPSRYEVENMKRLNSKDNDFCPAFGDKKYKTLYFASSREGATGKKTDAWIGQSFQDIFVTTQDKKGSWSSPSPLPPPVNTEAHEGCACLNEKGTTLYFTRCGKEKKKNSTCQIYTSEKKGKDWAEPQLLVLGPDSFSYGHPSLSANELELYFASNMAGGYGGKDIWVVRRDSKKKPWGKPENLGPTINTPGDEMYPYIREDSTLYFSSDGHVGMGGWDIFKVKKVNGKWGEPENMMSPINSSGNDYAIVFQGKEEQGYFTSDRTGGKGGDDIWRFYMPPLIFTLRGTLTDDSTKEVLRGVRVSLVRSDGFSISDTTDKKGGYKFEKDIILPNSTFSLTFSKDGYFTKKGQESTVGIERSKDLIYDETLAKIPETPIELPEILYDLGKWELKPQYQDSLNGLIKTLELNPKITIELSSHTDSRPIPMTNIELSKRRAQSVIDYLISKGIAADRMKAKGAGETEPKVLKSDVVKDGFKFKNGTVLTDEFINSLKSKEEKEAAHALNRRTEFRVLSKNYVPTKNSNVEAPKVELINVPTDNKATDDTNKNEGTNNVDENKSDQNKGQVDNKTNGQTPVKKDTKNIKTN